MKVERIAVGPPDPSSAKKNSPSIDKVGWSGDAVYLIVDWMNLGPRLAVFLSRYTIWRLAGERPLTAMGYVSFDVSTALHTDCILNGVRLKVLGSTGELMKRDGGHSPKNISV